MNSFSYRFHVKFRAKDYIIGLCKKLSLPTLGVIFSCAFQNFEKKSWDFGPTNRARRPIDAKNGHKTMLE